jgi:branched-chain amino acid transport system ATP-binding protein
MKLVEVKDLWVHYGAAEVLKGISFDVDEGAVVTLLGSNGAGKSTTLRTICGLKAPTSGEIWFNGMRIDGDLPQNIVRLGIGHVPEGKALFPYMTVLENLQLGAFLRKDKKQIASDMEDLFLHFPRLKERRQQQARTLSGGEQQMLAIARALMGTPKLLLLDEPSLGLSPMMVGEISKIVRDINQNGVTVILVEQNAKLALGVAQKGYVLETGSIVLQGESNELKNNDQVRKAYLGQ